MTAFNQAWERQEHVRHQTLLRQLKEELVAYRRTTQPPSPIISTLPVPIADAAPTPSTDSARPKLKTLDQRNLLKTVAVR